MTNEELALIAMAIGCLQSYGYNAAANAVTKQLFEYGKLVGEKSANK